VVGAAAFIAVVVLLASGLSTSSRAARPSRAALSAAQAQSISSKVNALIGKMTVAEKFGQLTMAGPQTSTDAGSQLVQDVQNGTVGSVLDLVGVNGINALQKVALQSKLHIPLIFSLDVIHGYKTMFPVPLAEASSWDPATVRNDESVSAAEATA